MKQEEALITGGCNHLLRIDHVSKTFVMNSGKLNKAVKEVCLGIPSGSVFGLLGMNGAGKTTLLHCIQGKLQMSDGDAYIGDSSCVNDLEAVRQRFGVCPQHDILWEFVTPREHLRAFAHLRGIPDSAVESAVSQLIERLDLSEKADAVSSTLSGGQKRRLSIALSVIGSPDVVFLDEPTTGLDPNTRRFVWNYILELRQNRVVVLTTHSMEEADALCSRLGIMVNGRLLSLGTPQQLKSEHGSGYRLLLRLDEGRTDQAAAVEGLLRDAYGDALTSELVASSETLRVFSVAGSDIKLGGLFQLMEDNREEKGIVDYSVSQTTMEQVFTKFAQFQVGE